MLNFYRNLKNIYNFNLYSIESGGGDYEKTDSQKMSPEELAEKQKISQEIEDVWEKYNSENPNSTPEDIKSQLSEKIQNESIGKRLDLHHTIENNVDNWMRKGNIEDKEKFLQDVNIESLNRVLKSGSIDDIYNKIEAAVSGKQNLYWYNNKELQTVLAGLGYQPDGIFGGNEAETIVNIVRDAKYAQDKINSNLGNIVEIRKVLLDFDGNGMIKNLTENNFVTSELEFFNGISKDYQFNNLIDNLNIRDFDLKLKQNYIYLREEIKDALRLHSNKNGRAMNQLLLDKSVFQESENKIEDILKSSSRKEIEKKFGGEVAEVFDKFVAQVTVGDVNGAGVSFDIKDITRNFLDNIGVGIYNGIPGVSVQKIFDLHPNLKASIGAVNGIIPVASISTILKEAKITKEDQKDYEITGAGFFSVIGGGSLNVSEVSKETAEGINRLKGRFEEGLKKIFDSIDNGGDFFKTGLEDNPKNREIYNYVKNNYNNPNIRESLLNAMVKTYEDALMREKPTFKISDYGVIGVGPLIIPNLTFEITRVSYVSKGSAEIGNSIVNNINNREQAIFISEKILGQINPIINFFSEKITPEFASSGKSTEFKGVITSFLNGRLNFIDTRDKFGKFLNENKEKFGEIIPVVANIPEKDLEASLTFILQNIGINLMKKEGLKVNDNGVVSIDKGRTILDYDRRLNRDRFFDEKFSSYAGDILKDIKNARKQYYEKYGKEKNFSIGQLKNNDGISFTGVDNGVNPYGLGHIAEFNGEQGKVKIESKSKDLVNNIPNYMLDPTIQDLERKGYVFKNQDNKYQEMKDLINNGGTDKIKINYDLFFAKAPECLNDTLILDLELEGEDIKLGNIPTFTQENNVSKVNFAAAMKRETTQKKQEQEEKTNEEGEPTGEEGGTSQTDTPGGGTDTPVIDEPPRGEQPIPEQTTPVETSKVSAPETTPGNSSFGNNVVNINGQSTVIDSPVNNSVQPANKGGGGSSGGRRPR